MLNTGTKAGLAALTALFVTFAAYPAAHAQAKLGVAPTADYKNRYEIFGGINLMNFQAGQNLPKRMNMGGVELSGSYWIKPRLGITGEFRGEAGTTPVFSNPYGISRPLVYMAGALAGVTYRGPRNTFAAVDYHAFGGLEHGVFDAGTAGNGVNAGTTPQTNAASVGLYSNRTKPLFALGGSLDINRSRDFALRLSPDLIIEHFGTETREFFAISGGIVYRFGKRSK